MSSLCLERQWDQSSSARAAERAWWSAGCDKGFGVGEIQYIFGFIGKHQCFGSDAGSYEKPVEGPQLRKVVQLIQTSVKFIGIHAFVDTAGAQTFVDPIGI